MCQEIVIEHVGRVTLAFLDAHPIYLFMHCGSSHCPFHIDGIDGHATHANNANCLGTFCSMTFFFRVSAILFSLSVRIENQVVVVGKQKGKSDSGQGGRLVPSDKLLLQRQ
jgi:hypothetical protein